MGVCFLRSSRGHAAAALCCACFFVVACGGDGSPPGPFEPGSEEGHPEPLGAEAGQARAGRLTTETLPIDRTGLGTWSVGDYVLANDRVAVIVEDAGESQLYDPWGGKVIGLGRVIDGRIVPADFNEIMTGLGRFTIQPTSVTVINDGRNGEAAVVRAIGPLRPLPFLDSLGRLLFGADFSDINVAIDYVLEPDADHVDAVYRLDNTTGGDRNLIQTILLAMQNDRMPAYSRDNGFRLPMGAELPEIAFIDSRAGAEGTSFAVSQPGFALQELLTVAGTTPIQGRALMIPAGETLEFTFLRYTIGGPDLDGLLVALDRLDGNETREITGRLLASDGSPATSGHVHALSMDGTRYLTRGLVRADGTYSLHVAANEAVQLIGFQDGGGNPAPLEVAAGATSAPDIQMPAGGFIHVQAQTMEPGASAAAPAPVRVQVRPVGGVERPGTADIPFSAFGERPLPSSDQLHVEFPVDGDVTLRVPAGTHRVIVSRGFEYDLFDDGGVVVADGQTVDVTPVLNRVVDTTDALCGDFHIHTARSPDSEDYGIEKARQALGDGLELPVRTDHEFPGTFEPELAELGATDWAFGIGAIEWTTFDYGHFGVFPFIADPGERNDGAPQWRDLGDEDPTNHFATRLREAPEMFAEIRARPEAPQIIMFHPMTGGSLFGYFEAVDLDVDTGLPGNTDIWDESSVQVAEIFNDSSFIENEDASVAAWFALMRRGIHLTAVGSSDSHKTMRGAPVGYPRTCVTLGTDDPTALRGGSLTPAMIRDEVTAGHVTVDGGIYVTAVADSGEVPGDMVTGADPVESIRVVVQAPEWVAVDALEVYVDGVLDGMVDLSGATGVTRHDADVAVNIPAGSSFVVFHVRGPVDGDGSETASLGPVHSGSRPPFGVTNAIFFER